MIEKIKIPELDIEVEDISDYEEQACEILDAFCDDLEAKGMSRPVGDEEKDWAEHEGITYLWSQEAATLIRKKLDELYSYGTKYFGRKEMFTIKSKSFIEP